MPQPLRVEDVASVIVEHVARALAPYVDMCAEQQIEIRNLKQRLLELESRPPDDANMAAAVRAAVPASFMVNEDGALVSMSAQGEIKTIGHVRGEDGERGAAVMDCHVDDNGALIQRLSDGRILNAGIVRGPAGKDGINGAIGPRGRDACELSILPGLDEARSYAEGTSARWRGGVIRAERDTAPIENGDIRAAGWAVVLNGIAEQTEREIDEGRWIERLVTYTDGTTWLRRQKMLGVIDRGIWQAGSYTAGDGVTFGGSFWIAQCDTEGVPEKSREWRLAVKRGRDGKDAK